MVAMVAKEFISIFFGNTPPNVPVLVIACRNDQRDPSWYIVQRSNKIVYIVMIKKLFLIYLKKIDLKDNRHIPLN